MAPSSKAIRVAGNRRKNKLIKFRL